MESSPEVQAIYRDCRIFEPCAGTNDSLALLPQSPQSPVTRPHTPTSRRARRSTAAASEQSFASSEVRSSASTEVQVSPESSTRGSAPLYLPPTPYKDPAVESPDFIPYRWDYLETVYLCVLSIHARLSSKNIASVLNKNNGTQVDEEDVEMKIDELSGEEYGIWEAWGSKDHDHSEVKAVLRRLDLIA